MDKTIYQEHGYESRKAYLIGLSEENDMPINTVLTLAALLGPSEDFDGLVIALQDAADGRFDD
jgi:hypothetical protein